MSSPATPSTTAPAASVLPVSAGFAETYERVLVGPLFRPWATRLLDAVPLAPEARVLDVACGTGIVARLARERVGGRDRVVGVDRNPAMLAVARVSDPAIDWREGDAGTLPVAADERFDAVLCHQGLQFFPDKLAAVRAMRAVMAQGGWVGIGVWRRVEENGVFHDLDRVAERFVGAFDDARHGFADPDVLARLLENAGFMGVRVEQASMTTRFEVKAEVLARLNAMAAIGMSAKGRGMPDAERDKLVEEIVAASVPEMRRYAKGGSIEFPTSANIATGRA